MSTKILGTLLKDPNETRIFYMDWSAHLDTATIASSTWTASPTGLTIEASSVLTGNTKTAVTLSGGTDRIAYELTNTVTTSAGEIFQRTGELSVRSL